MSLKVLASAGLALAVCAVEHRRAAGEAQFWLSTIGTASVGSAPPENEAALPGVQHLVGETAGSLYLWARPETGKTLKDWTLRAVATRPDIVQFTGTTIYNDNLASGGADVRRWQFTTTPAASMASVDAAAPTEPGPTIVEASVLQDLQGFSVFGTDPLGLGIGAQGVPTVQYPDARYNAAQGAWLLGQVDYSLTSTLGTSEIYLQIGALGMSHREDEGQSQPNSSFTNVRLGALTDPLLNAGPDDLNGKRHWASKSPEAFVAVVNPNFDEDGDVDGVDFLAWQRGFGLLANATLDQGDANGDGAVNGADLAHWRAKFGATGLTPGAAVVPEPGSALMTAGSACLAIAMRRRRRAPKVRHGIDFA